MVATVELRASASAAYEFISSCVDYLCATPAPGYIACGTSLYDAYCAEATGEEFGGIITTDPRVQEGMTTDPVNQGDYSATIPEATGAATETVEQPTSIAEESDGGGFDRSDKIALGVGVGIGLPATIGTSWMCVRGR